jgi:protoheme IX farnesyltransferase
MQGAIETPAGTVVPRDPGVGTRILRKAAAYLALTKPRVIELLLVTTAPVMVLAAHGIPNLWLVLGTLVGGTLSAAWANSFNC